MASDVKKLLRKNEQLDHLESAKVASHVQREVDDGNWILHSVMLEKHDVPFKFRRKKRYRSLEGARVNITYYPIIEQVAGLDIEVMKVVRIRRS